jgi:hypothetical protein
VATTSPRGGAAKRHKTNGDIRLKAQQMTDRKLYCTACGKADSEAQYLLAGPNFNMCDECILSMAEIVASQNPEWRSAAIERISKPQFGPIPPLKKKQS